MKRKDYQKPTMSTNLDEEDDIDISDTPGSIWGR